MPSRTSDCGIQSNIREGSKDRVPRRNMFQTKSARAVSRKADDQQTKDRRKDVDQPCEALRQRLEQQRDPDMTGHCAGYPPQPG